MEKEQNQIEEQNNLGRSVLQRILSKINLCRSAKQDGIRTELKARFERSEEPGGGGGALMIILCWKSVIRRLS